MHIKRIDFVIDDDQEMSLLYDEDVLTEEEAKEIINHPTVQMSGFSNLVLEKNTPCFFLSTP